MIIIYNLAFIILLQFSFASNQASELPKLSPHADSQQSAKNLKAPVTNTILKSSDGGQTWQDISKGLPGNLGENGFLANENGLYLSTVNGMYHSKPNAAVPNWNKEISPKNLNSITPGKNGIFAYNYWGQVSRKENGTNQWSPININFQGNVQTVFESAQGAVFVGSNNGIFKSTNSGKTWKHVRAGGWVMKMVESNGVLVATSVTGIIRSTDDGENWTEVINEGGVGIDVATIKGGFAAITFNTALNIRRVRSSYDGGETWQLIDADLPAQLSISSIIQVGESLFCGHPKGIYISLDKGKTWKLLLPSVGNKVFNIFGTGNTIYAIPRAEGC